MRHTSIIIVLLLLAASARAQSSAQSAVQSGPQSTQSVVAGGGGASASGSFEVEGTIGQSPADASVGGPFKLESGFWSGAAAKAQATLSVDNLSAVYGGKIDLKATLSATGADRSGKLITFSLNGTNVGTATTDANGLAVLSNVGLAGINAGTYATGISAEFAGDIGLTAAGGAGKLTITKANPLLAVAGGSFTYDGQPHAATVSATGVNNEALGPVSVLYNGTVNIPVNAGSYAITATFAGNQNYNSASNNLQSIIIGKKNQAITFAALPDKAFGSADFTISATASSGLAVKFAAAGKCTVNGNTVHITGAGSCTITASQAGDNNRSAATPVAQSFSITKATTTTGLSSSVNPSDLGENVTFTATVSSAAGTPTGTVQFKVDGSNAAAPVALNANGAATFSTKALAAGKHTVTGDYGGDGNFSASTATLAGGQVVKSQPSLSINDVSVTEGNSGTTPAVFTVSLSTASKLTVKVDFNASGGAAAPGVDYQATSGTLTFNPGDLTKSVTVPVKGDTSNEPDEPFHVNLTNPQNAALARAQATGTILNDDASGIQFSAPGYSVEEDGLHATVTVNRVGDLSAPATVDYMTSDDSALTHCSVTNGTASQRCDYAMAIGTLRFAAGESARAILLPVVDDSYLEGPETFRITLSNPAGASLGPTSTASIMILDDDNAGGPNPVDRAEFFVRQHYMDFLDREPEPTGLQGWLNTLNNCGITVAQPCDRVEVSSDFFRSDEFQMRGYYIYRFYTALGRKPHYAEFMPDSARVSGFQTRAELEANKTAFVDEFMSRQEFKNKYDSTLNNPAGYVDELLHEVGLPDHPARATWIDGLTNHALTRAQVLRALIESEELYQKFYNTAFVVEMYFGYLRRDPDSLYLRWIQTLDQTGDYRTLVNGFVNSQEYRQRFGP